MPKKSWPVIRSTTNKNGTPAFIVDARIRGHGKRIQCSTKDEAKTLAEQLRIKRTNAATSAFEMPDHERIDAQAALDKLRPHGRTLVEATRFYLKHISVVQADVPLQNVVTEMLTEKRQDGMKEISAKSMRNMLRRFTATLPAMKVAEVTTKDCDTWLRSQNVGNVTRNSYRSTLNGLFAFALKKKYVVENVIHGVPEAKVVPFEPRILTVLQCTRLLECTPEQALPAMAVCLFAGLRPMSEMMLLDWEHLNFETREIDIAAHRTKSATKRFVTIQDNLAEWLLPYRKAKGPLLVSDARSYSTFRNYLILARNKSGISDWPHDGMRHTFGSMHYAHFKDAGLTAWEMGHQGTTMLFKHYRARVKEDEAAAFWNIRPGRQDNVIPMLATA